MACHGLESNPATTESNGPDMSTLDEVAAVAETVATARAELLEAMIAAKNVGHSLRDIGQGSGGVSRVARHS